MKRFSLVFILAAMTMAGASALAQTEAKPIDMSEKIFDPSRNSAKDIADAVKLAMKQNKRILLDVGGNWCPWCHLLDNLFKSNQDIASELKEHYIVVKVNFSKENENKELLSQYPKIPGYPHIFVLEKNGKLLHSQNTGLLENGDHHDPAKVMRFLKTWAI
ncbi:MAG: thioredoxin family protein [Armatimonadetes bacterium]|nr:thioredoxin family protein [Armatimonadota bacterium]